MEIPKFNNPIEQAVDEIQSGNGTALEITSILIDFQERTRSQFYQEIESHRESIKHQVRGKFFLMAFTKVVFTDQDSEFDRVMVNEKLEQAWELCGKAVDFLAEKDSEALDVIRYSEL